MLNSLSRWFPRQRRRPTLRSHKFLTRPQLEALEDRLVPAVLNVISTGDNTDAVITAGHTGTAADPFLAPSLRSAITFTNGNAGGNTINLAVAGTYQITIPGAGEDNNATGDFDILPSGGDLTILNTSGGTAIVDGAGLDRVFDINPADTNNPFTVTLQGFTIQNGNVTNTATPDGISASGGGIRDQGNASLTLTNMVVTNNAATADGGGLVMANTVNSSWTLTINNSTISNNHAGDAGGGVDTDGAGTVVINPGTVITGNTDQNQGAGIYVDAIQVGTVFVGASMNMTGTVVSNNSALAAGITSSGGGISNAGNSTITLTNCTVANNFSGGMGGGFSDENNQGTLIVVNSLFLNNTATGDGGAIQEGGPSTSLTNTEIKGNSSGGNGGGLFANGTTLTVTSSTFANNTALGNGGGIELQTSGTGADSSTITNTTLTGNSALSNSGSNNGGGLDASSLFTGSLTLLNDTVNANIASNGGGVFWAGVSGSTFSVQNTIVALNRAATGPDLNNPAGTFTDDGGNVIGIAGAGSGNTGFTASSTQTGTVASPLDPMLGPPQNNGSTTIGAPGNTSALETEALLLGSPAVDKGVVAGAPTVDERGFVRPAGNDTNPDVGAFEFQNISLLVTLAGSRVVSAINSSIPITITVENLFTTALPDDNSTVTVTLSPGLTETAAPAGATVNGNTITFPLGALAGDSTTTFTLTAIATTVGSQTFTATVTGPDLNPARITQSETRNVANVRLGVSVSATKPALAVGDNDTFTVRVTNTGTPDLPVGDASVTVTLPAGLSTDSPLTFNVGALPANQSATFNIVATATGVGSGTVTATVTSLAANPVSVSSNTPVSVENVALNLALSPSNPTPVVGSIVAFTLTVTNTSTIDLPDVTSAVSVALPAGLTAVAGSPVTYHVGALAAGQSVSFVVAATATGFGPQTVTATLGSVDGNPPIVTASTTITVLTTQERFVQAVYQDELGRTGSLSELDFWVGMLNSGSSQTTVAGDILRSSEARDHLVKGWYVKYLGREAINGEEQFWVNELLAGQTEEQVLSQILGTGEFFNHAQTPGGTGTPQEQFVQALYQLLLNRMGSASDVTFWLNTLSTQSNAAVALAFMTGASGTEFRTDVITGYYNNLLHRPPDATGLTFWVSSGMDLATIRSQFEGTPEFFING